MNENKELFKFSSSYTVEGVIAANSRDEAYEYLLTSTPEELKAKIAAQGKYVEESYDEEILYEIKDKSTLVDLDITQRQIPLDAAVINCCDEIMFTDDELLEFAWELWLDVDKYFGTDTKDKDDTWINFYTYFHDDGDVTAKYFIDSDDGSEEHDWILTQEEKSVLLEKMEKHCQKRSGQSVPDLLMRMRNEELEKE